MAIANRYWRSIAVLRLDELAASKQSLIVRVDTRRQWYARAVRTMMESAAHRLGTLLLELASKQGQPPIHRRSGGLCPFASSYLAKKSFNWDTSAASPNALATTVVAISPR